MKYLVVLFLALSQFVFAQNSASKADDMGRIVLATVLPDNLSSDMNESAQKLLKVKLSQLSSQNGLGGYGAIQKFIITANVIQTSKEITPTAPPMVAMNLDVTLYIADNQTKTKFTSTSVSVKGVGTNDTKAYLEALKTINISSPVLRQFIETGKTKIMEYYNSQCDFILKRAQSLAAQNKFEESIYELTMIPDVCKSCFDKAQDAIVPLHKKYMEKNCVRLLSEANMAFAASPTYEGAEKARTSLAQIDPDAECFKQAQVLTDTIRVKIQKIEGRNWDFTMKSYTDEVELQKAKIQAYKEVGTAYGTNQPKQQLIKNNDFGEWLY